jgi:hypothetical protein
MGETDLVVAKLNIRILLYPERLFSLFTCFEVVDEVDMF